MNRVTIRGDALYFLHGSELGVGA